jgi:hypothetical protein
MKISIQYCPNKDKYCLKLSTDNGYYYTNFFTIIIKLNINQKKGKEILNKFKDFNVKYIKNGLKGNYYFKDKTDAIKAKEYFESYITMSKIEEG